MELKELGERLKIIRKHLGIKQQQLAEATQLTQPAISRLERGDEVYATTLLAVLGFYHDKVCLDKLFAPDLTTVQEEQLYTSRQELRHWINQQLDEVATSINRAEETLKSMKDII